MTETQFVLAFTAGALYVYLATGCVVYVFVEYTWNFTDMDAHPNMILLWPVIVFIILTQIVLWPFETVYGWWEKSKEYRIVRPRWDEQRESLLATTRKYNMGVNANREFYVSNRNWIQDYLELSHNPSSVDAGEKS